MLVMDLGHDASIMVGKKGFIDFQKGCYVYVGSALNGLEQRIQRHLRSHKKMHWHVDYFLPFTSILAVFSKESTRREECRVARLFDRYFLSVPGFGCSDCSCKSHLFIGFFDVIRKVAASASLQPFPKDKTKTLISTQIVF